MKAQMREVENISPSHYTDRLNFKSLSLSTICSILDINKSNFSENNS